MRKILILLFLCFYAYCGFASADILYGLKGKSLSYNEIVSAQKTILFFWTSHCPYCIKEFVYINQNLKLLEGINIYFINLEEADFAVNNVVKHLGLNEKIVENILLDKNNFLGEKFTIVGVPTYIFMVNGEIVNRTYYIDEELLREVFKK
jgi:thiol-disulfide isomerase/thioredoxin